MVWKCQLKNGRTVNLKWVENVNLKLSIRAKEGGKHIACCGERACGCIPLIHTPVAPMGRIYVSKFNTYLRFLRSYAGTPVPGDSTTNRPKPIMQPHSDCRMSLALLRTVPRALADPWDKAHQSHWQTECDCKDAYRPSYQVNQSTDLLRFSQ